MKTVGVCFARMNSRRFPGKNTRLLAGKPLIRYTVEFAKGIGLPLYVLTRDLPVMEQVTDCPIVYEPKKLAEAQHNVTLEMLRCCNQVVDADYLVLLQPTQPTRNSFFVRDCIKEAIDACYDVSCTISTEGKDLGLVYVYSREYVRQGKGVGHNFIWTGQVFDIDTRADLERCEAWLRG